MISHGRSGADFRACRELMGYTQDAAARSMGIEKRTIKRWESPNSSWSVMDYGWRWVDRELEEWEDQVDGMFRRADDAAGPEGRVVLVLTHSSEECGDMGGRPFSFHNSVVREVWRELDDADVDVSFAWSSDADADDPHVVA